MSFEVRDANFLSFEVREANFADDVREVRPEVREV